MQYVSIFNYIVIVLAHTSKHHLFMPLNSTKMISESNFTPRQSQADKLYLHMHCLLSTYSQSNLHLKYVHVIYFGFLKLGCELAGPKSNAEVPDNIMIKYGHYIVL